MPREPKTPIDKRFAAFLRRRRDSRWGFTVPELRRSLGLLQEDARKMIDKAIRSGRVIRDPVGARGIYFPAPPAKKGCASDAP